MSTNLENVQEFEFSVHQDRWIALISALLDATQISSPGSLLHCCRLTEAFQGLISQVLINEA